jgi:peptidoglycan/xylan/chitin deacetylase (PgdA/CDA1 family)
MITDRAGAAPEPTYLQRILSAADLMRDEAPHQAEDEFAAANFRDYADPLGWAGLGAARLAQGYVDRAMADFAQGAELAAKGPEQARAVVPLIRLGRAVCLLQRGEVKAAREELNALASEGYSQALPTLAYCELVSGDRSAADATARQALERTPDDPLALSVLARASQAKDPMRLMLRALALCPDSRYAMPASALAIPNTARTPAPSEPGQIRIEIKNGQSGRVIVTWLGPGEPGYVMLRVDDHDAGISNVPPHEFGMPRELGPGPHGVVAEVRSDAGVVARTGLLWFSTAPGAAANRYDNSEYSAAVESLRSALTPIPNRLHMHYWLATAYARTANPEAALHHYERVVALDPRFADARQRALRLCASLGIAGSTADLTTVRGKQVCITLDDGPNAILTPRILDVLRAAHVHATFFVVGTQARDHPELLRAIAAAGHEIANHSYSHDDMTRKSPAEVQQELLKTQVVVQDATGRRTRFFRPPGGRRTSEVRAAAAALGYRIVLWSANIGKCAGLSPQKGVARLLQDIGPGAIILLHNGPDETIDVLPGLLSALKQRGYVFATLSEALKNTPERRTHGRGAR